MNRDYYVMKDTGGSATSKIRLEDAHDYNQRSFGIFWTVNDFGGERRIRQNLKKINSWFVECDDEPKATQIARIEKCPLYPSQIVESKRGYQIYFNAKAATTDTWKEIMARLSHYFNGDPKARDVTRLLRVPGYYHWKDPENPFHITQVHNYDLKYTEAMMLKAFPALPEKREFALSIRPQVTRPQGAADDFWSRVYNLNCIEALRRLSGSSWVRYERYDFVSQGGTGKQTIICNGKPSSCWIDSNGRIGSLDKGGPTIWQWLKWFGHTDRTIAEILKTEVPELWT
jgi:hypothetical protein